MALAEAWAKLPQGLIFIGLLPKEADVHYAGRGVSLGAAARPIFWYRPKRSKKYRVLYGDFSLREADVPPNVPHVQPPPTTSILRHALAARPGRPEEITQRRATRPARCGRFNPGS